MSHFWRLVVEHFPALAEESKYTQNYFSSIITSAFAYVVLCSRN